MKNLYKYVSIVTTQNAKIQFKKNIKKCNREIRRIQYEKLCKKFVHAINQANQIPTSKCTNIIIFNKTLFHNEKRKIER